MLAQLEKPTNDFHALATYLVHGGTRPTPTERVAWIIEQNLGIDDPMLAAKLMTATAELSKRCKNACYHTIIAWNVDERPTPKIMQEVARRTLDLAGLGEHQALVMGHGDKEHPHLHMMINRVHPGTGRAWSTAHDYRRFDAIMRQLSDEYGFLYVPGHAFAPEETDAIDKLPNSNARYAAKRGANTTRRQWSAATRRTLSDTLNTRLTAGSTRDDLHHAAVEHGLTLEPKGKGWVIGDGTGYAKLSGLGLSVSAKPTGKMNQRHAPRKPQSGKQSGKRLRPSRSIWAVDAVDIARALGSRDDLRNALNDAKAQRMARIAKLPLIDQLIAELMRDWRASTGLRQRRQLQKRQTRLTKIPARDRQINER